MIHLHHTHLLSTDLDDTITFWKTFFRAEVKADFEFAGSRNVFLAVGAGRLHFYEQPPKHVGQGTVHHLGIETDELDQLVLTLQNKGHSVTEIKRFPDACYAMVMGPDSLLIELFQPIASEVSERLKTGYFHTVSER